MVKLCTSSFAFSRRLILDIHTTVSLSITFSVIFFTLCQIFFMLLNLFFLFQEGKEEVLDAWYMDNSDEDQRLPHHREPKEFVSLERLSGLKLLD